MAECEYEIVKLIWGKWCKIDTWFEQFGL